MKQSIFDENGSMTVDSVISKYVYPVVAITSILFLGFIGGSFIMYTERFPSNHLADAYRGGTALFEQQTKYAVPWPAEVWQPQRTEAKGVTIYDSERAYNGLTLYTSGQGQEAFLVDMEGNLVHKWQLPFSAVWDKTAAVKNPSLTRISGGRRRTFIPTGTSWRCTSQLAIHLGAMVW